MAKLDLSSSCTSNMGPSVCRFVCLPIGSNEVTVLPDYIIESSRLEVLAVASGSTGSLPNVIWKMQLLRNIGLPKLSCMTSDLRNPKFLGVSQNKQ